MNPSKEMILLKNDKANLRKGDVLEVVEVFENVAFLRVVHRKKEEEIIDLPSDTLGVNVSDRVNTEDVFGRKQ